MQAREHRPSATSCPRAVVVGSYRDPLGFPSGELPDALGALTDIVRIPAGAPLWQAASVFTQASHAIRHDGYEMVHLLDPRFAVVGMMLRRHLSVPVSVSVSSADAGARSPFARIALRALNHLDHGFTAEASVAHMLRDRAPLLPISMVVPAASALPAPSNRGLAEVTRALNGVRPGRLVVALPWPENRNDLRWFRDFVLPRLNGRPVCLLLGVRSRRQARSALGALGTRDDFRVLGGRMHADVIASAARCVDAFVLCGANEPAPSALAGQLAIALAAGGVPVVTNAATDARVLAHERNAFVVEPGDERGFVHTLNQMLALPAIQRHFLGEEFARSTLSAWPWQDVASAYAERFASLVGRPQIPAELRAA